MKKVKYQIKNNEEVKPVYTRLENKFKSNWHIDYLHSHNRQQLFKQLAQDWKSYFNSIKDYKKNPIKYKGQPKPPNFKYLDNLQQVRIKRDNLSDDWYGRDLIKIDTFFASSQLCNNCGYKNEEVKDLKIRKWKCPECGKVNDRDINASKNILNEGLKIKKAS